MTLAAPTAAPLVRTPGRVAVSRRAFESAFALLAAEELGVTAGDLRVRVADAGGRLGVRVDGPAAVGRGVSVLALADAVRTRVLADGATLSGAQIADVRVRITAARVREPERVR